MSPRKGKGGSDGGDSPAAREAPPPAAGRKVGGGGTTLQVVTVIRPSSLASSYVCVTLACKHRFILAARSVKHHNMRVWPCNACGPGATVYEGIPAIDRPGFTIPDASTPIAPPAS